MVLKLKQLNIFFLRCQFLASERHNLHEDLFLIDPVVISLDGESLLNALLYGSDEFNDRTNNEILLRFIRNRADDARVEEEGINYLKQKLFKGCHQGQNVTECLELKYFSVFHGPSPLKSISPALPNLALICAVLHRKLISLRCMLGGIFLYILLLELSFLVLFSSICLKYVMLI